MEKPKPRGLSRAQGGGGWRFTCAALALAGLAVAACKSSPTTPRQTGSSAVGRYNLVSANGQTLPAVVSENPSTGFKQEVTGGYTDLRADLACVVATDYRYTDSGRTSTSSSRDEGTYSISGNTVVFTFGRDQLMATLAGDVLTVRADVELVYRRQ